jgi:hypothetical protein
MNELAGNPRGADAGAEWKSPSPKGEGSGCLRERSSRGAYVGGRGR